MRRRFTVACLAAAAVAGCGAREKRDPAGPGPSPVLPAVVTADPAKPKLKPEPRAPDDPLTRRLSLEQQAAQVLVTSPATATAGLRPWGGVVVARGDGATAGTLGSVTANARFALRGRGPAAPIVIAEQAGGEGTAVSDLPPGPPEQFSGHPAHQAERAAAAAGRRLKALGVDAVLAPPADVDVEDGALADRVISGDPQEVERLTAAEVKGFAAAKLAAFPGHFPGAGAASGDPDVGSATVGLSLDELRQRDLVPFTALAKSAPGIQLSNALYAAWDGVTPGTLEPEIGHTLLRRELGFSGVVLSADLAGAAHVLAQPAGRTAVDAFRARSVLRWQPVAKRD